MLVCLLLYNFYKNISTFLSKKVYFIEEKKLRVVKNALKKMKKKEK